MEKENFVKKLNKSGAPQSPRRLRRLHMRALLILSSLLLLSFAILAVPGMRTRVGAAAPPQTGSPDQKISESAQLQIKALLEEKESRTPTQQKIDSQLIYAGK